MSFSVYSPRPILIDSSYRNRVQFPNQADFLIPFANQVGANSVEDPILNAYILLYTAAGVVTYTLPALTAPYFPAPFQNYNYPQLVINLTTNTPNLYVGDYLQIPGKGSQKIIAVFPNTPVVGQATVFVDAPYTVAPALGDDYYIRQFAAQPIYGGPGLTTLAGVGAMPVMDFIFPAGASTVDNFYNGKYLYFLSGANAGLVRPITSYTGATLSGTVSAFPFPMAAGDAFEVLSVYMDNFTPWRYGGSIFTEQQFVNYSIKLCYLMLPNQIVFSGYGGNISTYPYVMIRFQSVQGGASEKNTIQSNNPFSNNATLLSQIDGYNFDRSFVISRGCCCEGAVVKLSPASDIRFTVYLPNGDILKYDPTMETFSPLPANPQYQIVMFAQIQRLV